MEKNIYGNTCYKLISYKPALFDMWVSSILILDRLPVEHNMYVCAGIPPVSLIYPGYI